VKDKFKYSIICCYYNELGVLKKKLNQFLNIAKKFAFTYEIFLIDNHSNDGTKLYLRAIKKRKYKNVRVIFNKKNLGKGGSIKKCCKLSKSEYCAIFDIDEYAPSDLVKANEILNKNKIDFLLGSRILLKNSFIYKINLVGVVFFSYIINFLYKTNITDSAAAIKIFKRDKFKKLNIKTTRFDFEFDLLCQFAKKRYIIKEFPIRYFPRTYEEGKKIRVIYDGLYILYSIIKNYFMKK
jgi:glycosyltransferase involved in cell wall biosynthesis